ncbi:uncharacterized protein PHALS_09502 [Plasmopara halstedii]|uniref:RxLR-like protein n=1 Tax=Plasmopara halstedii TaxID=4781 RepID=A0A0N7L3B1_PLAHL|nr:uncharacterized protein PHALS_09502 [Plasmopara halstedii]CEG35379.1 hypothetical protein PHALS_09502 [Plasmopara halstedii]|eukprot:XP_024571748.1 hypothetical protein PHALS_09502 [Plasmopara halstedii]
MLKSFFFGITLTAASISLSRATCAEGENQMSVEGVRGIFCVAGDPCIATFSTGACPAPQVGLPNGSYCGVVASGVYGCKINSSDPTMSPLPTESPSSQPTPQNRTPGPTTADPVPTISTKNCEGNGTRVSVQGLKGSYCVDEPVCVQNVSTGNCPGPQDGLQFGSFCDLLKTGVYGCRQYTAYNVKTNVTYDAPLDCSNNAAGDTPVSIVSAAQDFCAPKPVCAGTIFGNCPKVQNGLAQDSECMVIDESVYGCVFMASS